MNVRQGQQLGLGHSILCARPAVGNNPFVVVLPDIILDGASADPLRYNRRQWSRVSMKPGAAGSGQTNAAISQNIPSFKPKMA